MAGLGVRRVAATRKSPAGARASIRACRSGAAFFNALMVPWSKSLKQAFCEAYHCPAERYVTRALRQCLPVRVRLMAPLLRVLRPDFFNLDRELVERAGEARSWADLNVAIAAFASYNQLRRSFLRRRLGVRASGRRLTRLARRLQR